jgi:hypothetical protein
MEPDLVNSCERARVQTRIHRQLPTMSTPRAARQSRAGAWRLGTLALSLGAFACTDVTGGAVELSWALRTTRDVGLDDCAGDAIGRIRLWWETDERRRFASFPCRDNNGVTAFDLPLGSVSLDVTPECSDGTTPAVNDFVAPPPITRTVALGEAITLDAILLVVKVDDCAAATCICGRPCACASASGPPLANP